MYVHARTRKGFGLSFLFRKQNNARLGYSDKFRKQNKVLLYYDKALNYSLLFRKQNVKVSAACLVR